MDVSCGSSYLVHSGIEHLDKAGCDELVMHAKRRIRLAGRHRVTDLRLGLGCQIDVRHGYSGTVAGRSEPVANQLLW